MSKDQMKKRWTAYGRNLVQTSNGSMHPSADADNPLDIFEELQNIKMGDGTKGPYGIPISTGVAVTLIKNMLEAIKSSGHDIFGFTGDEDSKNDILGKLILNSMGVTFDKSQLLRIISQPRCEGVRFYHAVRKDEQGKGSATLVLVGVDKDGYDLNYNLKTPQTIQAKQNDTCESLVDDWGHPPGGNLIETLAKDKAENERYVLLRMAEDKK